CGDPLGIGEVAVSSADFPVAGLAFATGLGDSSAVAETPVLFLDFSVASFAFGIGLGDFSGEGELARFFFDLSATALAFAIGLGDFFGARDEASCVSCCAFPDSSRWLFSSSLTWARRRLPTIAPSATAVASQRRKRTTATERNRARDAIIQPMEKKIAPGNAWRIVR